MPASSAIWSFNSCGPFAHQGADNIKDPMVRCGMRVASESFRDPQMPHATSIPRATHAVGSLMLAWSLGGCGGPSDPSAAEQASVQETPGIRFRAPVALSKLHPELVRISLSEDNVRKDAVAAAPPIRASGFALPCAS